MTSTTFDRRVGDYIIACVMLVAIALLFNACTEEKPQVRNRVPTMPTEQLPAVLPPVEHNAELPAPPPKAPTKERPFYGSTMFTGEVTSVYYYPEGASSDGTPDVATTHIKFDHREDDIWLCGDQRPKFTPGEKYRMMVTFEANTDCQTNWKLR